MTNQFASTARRRSIRRQAITRLVAVLAILVVGISLIGFNAFHTRQQREIKQKLAVTREFYGDLLPRFEENWLTVAEQTKSRIEFTRLLEKNTPASFAELNTFLTAQWDFLEFSNLVLLAPNGNALYRYGTASDNLPVSAESLAAGWHFDAATTELYRIFSLPIWLGKSGQGSLVLFKPINAGILHQLATPETHLHIHAFDRLIASSDPLMKEDGRPGLEGYRSDLTPPVIQIDMRWPHASPLAPTLVIHREFRDSISFSEFMLRPLGAIILVTLMLWFGLGRWLTRHVNRIETLDMAAGNYADGASPQQTVQNLLPVASINDEVSDVAHTLERLMKNVAEREQQQRSYLETLAMLDEAVVELDASGNMLHASPGWYRLTHSDDEVQSKSVLDFLHADDRQAMRSVCHSFRDREKSQALLRVRLRDQLNQEQWVETRLIGQYDQDGAMTGIRGIFRDITQTYLHEQQITHMALHDALTDLPNRILLEDRIKIALRMASRSEREVAVCFIDLDHFKKINDTLGHKAGDRMLVSFATTLRELLRSGDTLARWGGDEFVLLLPELTGAGDARDVANKVADALKTPIRIDDGEYVVTFSMGIALYPGDAKDVETLLSHADRAMFFAKTQGRNQSCFFGEISNKEGDHQELYIQNKLAEAIGAQRIQAWFQPIIAADGGPCQLVEVLARWQDNQYGWVSPATFIPIAENIGMIREVGQQIWQQTLAALIHWREAGIPMKVALNVSKRQLFSANFTEQLVGDLSENGFDMDTVIIEVTESVALLEVAHASQRIEDLHQIGFHIAIDDFGTGYSALSQLHEMPVNELKIDISFVRRIREPSGQSMVRAIIQLAKALDLKTIAEGVEDEPTATLLKSMGADYLQGYHYAKPMPRAEFDAWLQNRS